MNERVRRAIGIVLLSVVLAAGCTFAGFWQWHRGEDRERAVDIAVASYAAKPVPLPELLDSPGATLAETDTWRTVTLEGRYIPGSTVLLRNRPVAGTPSFHLLVPFLVSAPGSPFDGAVLVVDRGWVPIGKDASTAGEVPEPPGAERVALQVRLRPAERPVNRGLTSGQVRSIVPVDVMDSIGLEAGILVQHVYGSLVSEDPPPELAPGALPAPSTDYGPHRSYAMQWWVFALGALVGFGILARRELRDPAEEELESPRPRRERRRPTAEEEEDALIDAQSGTAATSSPSSGVGEAQASDTSSR